MVRAGHRPSIRRLLFLAPLLPAFGSGCAIVPRSRLDECQRLTQVLRAENARLKDQVLALQDQNRDYAERAVDDLRRLAARDQAIERLERSVQAYQEDRDRLGAAYRRLTAALGRRPGPSGASRDQDPVPSRGGIGPRAPAPDDGWPQGAAAPDEGENGREPPPARDGRTGP